MTTKMVPTEDGGHIPAMYRDFVEVFSKAKPDTLPPHRSIDNAIDFQSSYNMPYGQFTIEWSFQLS